MAQSFEYTHPHYEARRSETIIAPSTVSGTTGFCIPAFAANMSKVTMTTIIGGTTGTGATMVVTMGGSAVGTWVGTGAGGLQTSYTPAAPIANAALAVGNYVVTSTDATVRVAITWEYFPQALSNVTF
jgi:hypothetical protein